MQPIKTAALSCALFLSLSGCKKDHDSSQSKTPVELASSHKWKWYRIGDTADDVNITWDTVTQSCEKDNYIDFTNNTVIHDEGPTKCSPSDPQRPWGAHTWHFNSDNTKVVLDNGVELKILALTETSFTVIELDGPGHHDCYDWIPY